jgi:hypothetical protein
MTDDPGPSHFHLEQPITEVDPVQWTLRRLSARLERPWRLAGVRPKPLPRSRSGLGPFDVAPDGTVDGEENDFRLGWAVGMGDFDGDSNSDVVAGVPRNGGFSPEARGCVSVYRGGPHDKPRHA